MTLDARELFRQQWPLLLGAAPIAACVLGRGLAPGFLPSASHAAEADEGAAATVALNPLPAELKRATEQATAALALPMGPSPFSRESAPAPEPGGGESVRAVEPGAIAPPSEWIVTSIIADRRGGGSLAVINGKVRRAGEQAARGWVVERIDAAAGTVTLRGPGGAATTLTAGKRPTN